MSNKRPSYGHNVKHLRCFSDSEWQAICKDIMFVFKLLEEFILICDADGEKPLCHPHELFSCRLEQNSSQYDSLAFNGSTSQSESRFAFMLEKKQHSYPVSRYVRTDKLRYDFFVQCCLLIIWRHASDAVSIRSYAQMNEFTEAASFLATALNHSIVLPAGFLDQTVEQVFDPIEDPFFTADVRFWSHNCQLKVEHYHQTGEFLGCAVGTWNIDALCHQAITSLPKIPLVDLITDGESGMYF